MDTDGDGQRNNDYRRCSHRINLYRHQFHCEAIATSNWRFGAAAISMIHILNTNNIYLKCPWATERLPITISIAHASFLAEECAAEDTVGSTRLHTALFFLLFIFLGRQCVRTVAMTNGMRLKTPKKKKEAIVTTLVGVGRSTKNARTKSRRDFDIFHKLM